MAVWQRPCPRMPCAASPLVREPGDLLEKIRGNCLLALSDRLLEAAIGMATINSLLDVDETACRELNAAELLLAKGGGKGWRWWATFPFCRGCGQGGAALGLRKESPGGGSGRERGPNRSSPAEVGAITGTALTNHTLEPLWPFAGRPYTLLLGDTVPFSPIPSITAWTPSAAPGWRSARGTEVRFPGGQFPADPGDPAPCLGEVSGSPPRCGRYRPTAGLGPVRSFPLFPGCGRSPVHICDSRE
jgi:hypothetical protein